MPLRIIATAAVLAAVALACPIALPPDDAIVFDCIDGRCEAPADAGADSAIGPGDGAVDAVAADRAVDAARTDLAATDLAATDLAATDQAATDLAQVDTLPRDHVVTDAVSILPGCDSQFTGGCAKFANQENFGGAPYHPAYIEQQATGRQTKTGK